MKHIKNGKIVKNNISLIKKLIKTIISVYSNSGIPANDLNQSQDDRFVNYTSIQRDPNYKYTNSSPNIHMMYYYDDDWFVIRHIKIKKSFNGGDLSILLEECFNKNAFENSGEYAQNSSLNWDSGHHIKIDKIEELMVEINLLSNIAKFKI